MLQLHRERRITARSPAGEKVPERTVEERSGGERDIFRLDRARRRRVDSVEIALDMADIGAAFEEGFIAQERRQKRRVRGEAEQRHPLKRRCEPCAGLLARCGVRDHLGDHRVVEGGNLIARLDALIDAHARRRFEADDAACLRQEIFRRVFGVKARFDRVTVEPHIPLRQRQGLSFRDVKLQRDDIEARHHLRHRVLDLQARVHFEEIEFLRRGIEEELDGPGIAIADGPRRFGRRLAHAPAHLRGYDGRGRFLDHLLAPALQGTVALAEIKDRAVRIRHHLDFDMAPEGDRLFDDEAPVAERAFRFAPRGGDRLVQFILMLNDTLAAPAPAGRRLQHHRKADARRFLSEARVGLVFVLIARNAGNAGGDHAPL